MPCEGQRAALGLMALGELPAADAVAVERHLAGCPSCTAQLAGLRRFALLTPDQVPATRPPARVEARLLERISALRRERGSREGWRSLIPAAAAALLVLNLALGALSVSLYLRHQEDQQQVDFARHAVAELAAGSGRSLAVHSSTGGPAHGVFRMDAATGQAVLVAYNLPAPVKGHAYQGWMRHGAERTTIGMLAPNGPYGALVVRVDGLSSSLLSQVDGFGITLEPAGGSRRPTGPQVMTT